MDAETIMATVRSGSAPSEWNVWPLRRSYLLYSAFKWGLLALVGFAMFIPVLLITYPDDFVHTDATRQSLATIVVLIVGALAFGSLWITVEALLRARRAADYWLVITPDVFIKAEPRGLYHIPLEQIADITLKGVAQPTDTAVQGAIGPQFFALGRFSSIANSMGVRGAAPRRRGESPSLAFRDRRDNRVIVVGTDDSFDLLGAIDEILHERVAKKEEALRRAASKSQSKAH
jgi:hypothetical protein